MSSNSTGTSGSGGEAASVSTGDSTKTMRCLFLFVLAFYAVLLAVVFAAGVLKRPFWTDEGHFYATVLSFAQHLNKPPLEFLGFLRTYPELSSPFPFLLLAAVGKLIGFEVWKFRLTMLLISFLTMLALVSFIRSEVDETRTSNGLPSLHPYIASLLVLVPLAQVIINPYFLGTSVFIYTDIPALFFLVVSIWSFGRNKYVLSGIAAGLGLWCRQYLIFVPIGFLIWLLLERPRQKYRAYLAPILAIAVLVPLLLLWRGVSPVRSGDFLKGLAPGFHPEILVFNLIALFVYSLPVSWLIFRRAFSRRNLLLGLCFLPLFIFFPPRPLPYPELLPHTMGFFDKAVTHFLGGWKDILYFFLYYASTVMALTFIRIGWKSSKGRLWALLFLAFLVANLYGYLIWEKYILLVLPVVSAMLATDPETLNTITALFIKKRVTHGSTKPSPPA
ncbi:hypothetical protein CH330_08715 [candidate division WOR-3 bacterium JGI_Cruoil_03_51_56]|uniref:Uncharacterized protein n=1 Tax=candidate division WOR-3 bacterium JGI_Cruoil_03_51_56 TaxID=1973747 RepID=A0A235BQG3_UNCW3|nr:MAG: hypothetical protein CH330_08715 [candidate division WOR-3 bacterium JGI_Cruoil_03_51_56]